MKKWFIEDLLVNYFDDKQLLEPEHPEKMLSLGPRVYKHDLDMWTDMIEVEDSSFTYEKDGVEHIIDLESAQESDVDSFFINLLRGLTAPDDETLWKSEDFLFGRFGRTTHHDPNRTNLQYIAYSSSKVEDPAAMRDSDLYDRVEYILLQIHDPFGYLEITQQFSENRFHVEGGVYRHSEIKAYKDVLFREKPDFTQKLLYLVKTSQLENALVMQDLFDIEEHLYEILNIFMRE